MILILANVLPLRCDICSVDIPIHLKNQHKSQHKTEKEFEKGLEKGRVHKNKRPEVEKTVKKSGYMKFCSVMRPILKESHKPSPKQMMSLLGVEWRKLSKTEQQDWNKRAAESTGPNQEGSSTGEQSLEEEQPTEVDQGSVEAAGTSENHSIREIEAVRFNCPFCDAHMDTKALLKDHIAEIHIQTESNKGGKTGNQLNRIPVPNNQERISKCDICGKMVNRNELERHMTINHFETLKDFIEADEDLLVEDTNDDKSTEEVHEASEHDPTTDPEDTEPADTKVVMVKRKTLWWPAKVIQETAENSNVILLNQKKTKLTVSKDNIKPFSVDHSQMEGMKRDWRDAYMKAVKLMNESQNI